MPNPSKEPMVIRTEDEAGALDDLLDALPHHVAKDIGIKMRIDALIAAVAAAALRAAPVEGASEARAYEFTLDGVRHVKLAEDCEREEVQHGVPLYAHPAPDGARIPAALLRQYEHAAEKAASVGALKMLHKAEAAIGRWCLKALATPYPEDSPDGQ